MHQQLKDYPVTGWAVSFLIGFIIGISIPLASAENKIDYPKAAIHIQCDTDDGPDEIDVKPCKIPLPLSNTRLDASVYCEMPIGQKGELYAKCFNGLLENGKVVTGKEVTRDGLTSGLRPCLLIPQGGLNRSALTENWNDRIWFTEEYRGSVMGYNLHVDMTCMAER